MNAPQWSIVDVRKIVAECQAAKVSGHFCDLFTASAMAQFHDALNAPNQAKLLAFHFPVACHVMWGTLEKAKAQ